MAIDFVHTGELVDAVISVLKGSGSGHVGGLPSAWFTRTDKEGLQLLEHGDLADYAGKVMQELPAILVRGIGIVSVPARHVGGVIEADELIRVLHVRKYEQCYDSDGDREKNQARARERYAKLIGKAIFNDPQRRLAVIDSDGARTEVTLTSDDAAGAQIIQAMFDGWDLGYDIGNINGTDDVRLIRNLNAGIWAIACDLRVRVRTGGNA